ncbi:MAG: flagellar basal body L-ring protein FlgH [Candidatus Accumulibacter sp.]|uniref:flagellar basal body L-ring protein FlgH n=1 Tax=Accumulibacter sp. TaxID=2053492 RepID=UPI0019E53F79|nr:flagellar basal body L-ring protein FlgH [Accumulibacter sp.]MBE2258477.1 flagellar basal body L-ring protein FlgH [Paracoccaceae bacterium]MCB1941500.1 flagellar basal body L-ring protein FlgH [Accumulibacter sp.]MCP5249173.1 flagellar basal body L-ring protein FlgH [Accumulibacter sp.]
MEKRLPLNNLLLISAVLMMTACTTVPPTNIHQPMTARPQARSDALAANLAATGSIYQAGASRTLFEDRRARYVGDTITVSITENTTAATKSNSNVSKTGSINASVGPNINLPGKTLTELTASSSNVAAGKGDAAANNVFTGFITVTVIEVLPNGNLLVSGEKQVAIGHGQEYIRLSGIVNPYFVNAANTIPSSQIADARIEYKESGAISEAQVMGWLARFFLTVLPF